MSAKTTTMVLTVDLNCSSCYKKIKKILCKFPGIRDQVYDEKNNKVTIKVLCCDPEKVRDKLCCKGRKVIKSIQIVDDTPKAKEPEKKEPEKSKAPDKPKEPIKEVAKTKEQETTKAPEKSKDDKPKAKPPAEKIPDKPKPPAEKTPDKLKPKDPAPAPAPAPKAPEPVCGPVHGFPPMPLYPGGACCGSCAQGYGGGPCYQGYGRPVPPPPGPCYDYGRPVPCYDYGRPVPCYDYGRPVPPPPGPCYDYGYGYRGSKCCVSTDYFSEENPQGCTIM